MIVPIARSSATNLWLFVAVFSVATYALIFLSFGFSLRLVGLTDVAPTRALYKGTLSSIGPLVGYLVSNQSNVVNTFILTYGARTRNYGMITAAVIGQALIYSATGFKTAIMSVPLCILVGLYSRRINSITGRGFVLYTLAIALAAIVIDSIRDFNLTQVIINRLLVTSGYLTPIYLVLYDGKDKALWAYSFLSGITPDSYHGVSPGYYVGQEFLNRPDVQANANLFADGFANLGIFGIAIEALFLVALLFVLNSAARGLPVYIVVGTIAVPGIAIANGSPITSALSYGLLASIVLFALIPRDIFKQRDFTDLGKSRRSGN